MMVYMSSHLIIGKSKTLSLTLLIILTLSLFTFLTPEIMSASSGNSVKNFHEQSLNKLLKSHNAVGDNVFIASLVFKAGTPLTKIKSLYSSLSHYQVKVHGFKAPATVSNLVKEGENYVFKVALPLSELKAITTNYASIIKTVYGKPLLTLEEAKPGLRYVADGKQPVQIGPGKAKPNTFIVRQIIGADAVQQVYGFNGSGARIAIVDTGVDYGHPDLHDALTYYINTTAHIREPLILDADEAQVILLKSFQANSSGYINTKGENFTIYMPWEQNVTAVMDYYVGNITSQSGVYKFGMTDITLPTGNTYVVGVLMVDSSTSGNYTTLYIDLNNNGEFTDPQDIMVTYDGDRVLAKDLNGDGFPDISLGVAGGFFYDFGLWFSSNGGFYPGWSRNGAYISIFFDFYGHGTSCASAAAGRGVASILGLGIAPGAKVVGVKALWMGNTELGMLWAAGFNTNSSNGLISWSGSKRADIISNSWGISYFLYDIAGFGYDFESTFINGLMTPGFLDPNFPGILVVQAAGNGGSGFGTITSPAAAFNPLTVGASTSMAPFYFLYGFYGFGYDEVVSWSARGPTVYGLVKPDVVNVGAWGFTAAPVGINYWIFGGTSYATPLTAGAAAILYQALKTWGVNTNSMDPRLAKLIIMHTAHNIGYGPFMQGSGRVDIYSAVRFAYRLAVLGTGSQVEPGTILFVSKTASNNTGNKISKLWYWMWSDYIPFYLYYYFGDYLPISNPNLPDNFRNAYTYGVYVPDIPQGGSSKFTFDIANPTSSKEVLSIEAVRLTKSRGPIYKQVKVTTSGGYGYRYIFLSLGQIPSNANMLVIDEATLFNKFDVNNDYYPDYSPDIIVYVWVGDFNHNGYPDVNERVLINHDYSAANQNTVEIANPRDLLLKYGYGAKLAIRIGVYVYGNNPDVRNFPVKVALTYYEFTRDPYVRILSPRWGRNVPISPGRGETFTGLIRVPYYAMPSVYGDFLKITAHSGSAVKTYMVPFSYTVYTSLNSMVPKQLNRGLYSYTLYNHKFIKGDTDWEWRYEAGDWRVFYGKLTNPKIWAFEYTVAWTDPWSSYITYTLGPDGQFAGYYGGMGNPYAGNIVLGNGGGASYHLYLGSGRFVWSDTGSIRSANHRMVKTFPITTYRYGLYPANKPNLGVYTFIIRTGTYGGHYTQEPFKIYVRPLRGPISTVSKVYPATGTAYMKFAIPYSTTGVYAYPVVSYTPYFLSAFWCPEVNVMPESYVGNYPAWHTFTFRLQWTNECSYVSRNDISLIWLTNIPSIPVYYKYMNHYHELTTYYLFENWIITGLGAYG